MYDHSENTNKCGNDGKKDTPVTMPNTEVKLFSAEGSEGFLLVRVGRCHAFVFFRHSSVGSSA